MTFVLAVLAAAAAASQAPAGPSFPCAAARLAQERLVCARPELARADAEMAAAYRRAQARLSPEGRRQLAASQGAWIALKLRGCGVEVECLEGAYGGRRLELDQAVRRIGPLTVLTLESYLQAPPLAPEEDDPGGPFARSGEHRDNWIEPAGLSGPLRAAALRWNAGLAADPWFRGRRWRRGWSRGLAAPQEAEGAEADRFSVARNIAAASHEAISYERTVWTYYRGAAHGIYHVRYATILVRGGRLLRPEDLFASPDRWARHFLPRARAAASRHASLADMRNVESWSVRETGLSVDFGEVRGYAGGHIFLDLSWAELRPFLTPRGLAIARSFGAGRAAPGQAR